MRIRYCTVTLNQLQWVVDMHLPSIDFSIVDGLHLHVSEVEEQKYNGEVITDPLNINSVAAAIDKAGTWRITSSVNNLGVAHAWNYFIKCAKEDGFDAVIIANDDITLDEGTLKRFVEEMQTSKFVSFIGKNAFSFFGIHLDYAEEIGEFDENLWPAYFEDNDFHHRMKLRGFSGTVVDEPSYFHYGSATISTFDAERKLMHHHNFNQNKQYYIQKWGGLPGNELYDTPFNNPESLNYSQGGLVPAVINGIEQVAQNHRT